MHEHPTSAGRGARNCIYCGLPIPTSAAVSRAGQRFHAICLVLNLTRLEVARGCRRLRLGLLPAGEGSNPATEPLQKRVIRELRG